ncbi:hypothetical protein DSO57_1038837 [Entomophthora muscae]|uniref:Uncharacterized protein n=1 Tax=Entomophthora muscae TaxID=34485 RepID=A0ACC2SNE1_9FUNG|nr:hypothetical protein DSO57_1038837 [Entomophthora muscae]
MVFTSNIFDSTSSQASCNGGKTQNVEAPVYTQGFEAGNKEADLLLSPNPYDFDLFKSHLAVTLIEMGHGCSSLPAETSSPL